MNSKLIYMALISLLIIPDVFPQWVQTGGPYGSTRVTAVFANNNRIYAATSCGLHSTGSLTDKWDLKSILQIQTLVKKENNIYFGGTKIGIQRLDLSVPGFVPASVGLDGVTVITIKDGGACLYAGIEGQGFCSSTGSVNDWMFYNTGLPAEVRYYPPAQGGGSYYVRHVNSIEMMDNTLYCGTHTGVYKADKTVLIWSKSGTGLPAANVQQIKLLEGILYACQENSLYYSLDKGDSWNLAYTAGSKISSVERINDYIFITTLGSGIYLSPDKGQTWIARNDGLTDLNVTLLTLIEGTPVCGTQSTGVFYFNGSTWVNHSEGIICSDIRSMGVTGSSITANDMNSVYLATGTTSSWTNISSSLHNNSLGFVATMGDRIFLSYQSVEDNQHIKYSNGNDSWQDLQSSVPFARDDPYKMRVNGSRLYVYEDHLLYFTDDLGANWNNLTLSDQHCNDIYDFAVYKNIPFVASCGVGELLKLSDNTNWMLSNNGLPGTREITSMAYSADALYAYSYTNGMFISRDEGLTWTKTGNGFITDWDIRSFAYYEDNIFVSTIRGVYYSKDFGLTWNLMNEGLKNSNIGPLVISNDTLYAGTRGNGVWKHDLLDFLPPKEDTIAKIHHIRIFPNPATEFVHIDFPGSDKARVKLLDLLGREMISTIPGTEKQLSVSGLSSGTYLIVISTDQYSITNKLIIKRKE